MDVYFSYAEADNLPLVEGRMGWVGSLQRALELRLGQFMGNECRVWWDPKLLGNDTLADAHLEVLQCAAAFVVVVSPRYVNSQWARQELAEFLNAAKKQAGVKLQDKSRVFKVLKTPVPLMNQPPELQPLIGYEFFKVDPETQRVRELDEVFGPEAQREFWIKLDDLAHDIAETLELARLAVEP